MQLWLIKVEGLSSVDYGTNSVQELSNFVIGDHKDSACLHLHGQRSMLYDSRGGYCL